MRNRRSEPNAAHGGSQIATHEVAEYLAEQDVWVPKAPMIFGRFRFDAAYSGGSIYAFGGEVRRFDSRAAPPSWEAAVPCACALLAPARHGGAQLRSMQPLVWVIVEVFLRMDIMGV